ncbi:6-phosphogluconate dehydrogenase [Cyanidioschyzon merolae strain 10D]|uniref:6-phosphogluconate dehydrogenase n=1 Tax=Cyanidioschyzon merolae (strain NIES-3377 / 10D) TaxID=280699 RepID=M1VI23_CYAM1|nr:6-phosphogluconate dehydrogenase [Cyanidioschyzon merolae strain 10D]BAM80668.1 6-phosphogluconate dehydrogenase [Cyanidioschyzon merolae strain 10D]|eukprot:XP_005536704.1 6-phosphogluconate dehydrogenase [Cyanidioschyzon merolae strain 10D]
MSATEGSSPSSAVRESASSHPAGRAISDAGVIGLAVMGQNFALNLASHGWRVSVYNRTYARTAETVERAQRELAADDTTASGSVTGFADLRSFALSLKRPRRVFLLVKAGSAVDATVEALAEVLEPGDIIVDGGNEWYENTERRAASVAARGLLYVGMGCKRWRGGCALRAFPDAGRFTGGVPAACAAAGAGCGAGTRLWAVRYLHWAGRLGELCEDGAQRDRVRRYAADRRGIRPASGCRWLGCDGGCGSICLVERGRPAKLPRGDYRAHSTRA